MKMAKVTCSLSKGFNRETTISLRSVDSDVMTNSTAGQTLPTHA